jgi:hypothetical protein
MWLWVISNNNYEQKGMKMDFSGIFGNLDILIFKLMAVELFIGCFIGFIFKQIVKNNAKNNVDIQIVSPGEYSSIHFERNFPINSLDIFLFLPPEFILLTSENDEIVEEKFCSYFGSSTEVKYQNGKIKSYGSLEIEPIYLCTVLLPISIGFFLSFSTSIGQYFRPLLYSGFLWIIIVFLLQFLTGKFNMTLNKPE